MTLPGGGRSSVVVTGAAGGIGRASVERLVDDGWYVVAVDLDPRVIELEGPGRVRALVGDVSVRAVHEEATVAAGQLGALRGYVNNAAVQLDAPAAHLAERAVRRQLEVNLLGTMWGCSAAVQAMTGPGSVVSVSSIHALVGFPGAFAYAATKGAVVALARQLAVEYGPVGIRSNVVLPGAVDTPMCTEEWARADDPAAARAADEGLHLMGRMGQPSEVAAVIAFLLSEESSLITGQQLVADGGATARPPVAGPRS